MVGMKPWDIIGWCIIGAAVLLLLWHVFCFLCYRYHLDKEYFAAWRRQSAGRKAQPGDVLHYRHPVTGRTCTGTMIRRQAGQLYVTENILVAPPSTFFPPFKYSGVWISYHLIIL